MDVFTYLQTLQDPDPSGLQTLAHQNITSCEPLSNKRNSHSVTNSSDQETACVLRRSSRLEKLKVSRDAKYSDHMYKMPEKILPKILGCEDLTNNNSSAQNFRYAVKLCVYLQECCRHYR